METPDAALARAAVDMAVIGVLADGGLRRSVGAALTWGDVEYYEDGTARITIQRGKNQPADQFYGDRLARITDPTTTSGPSPPT